MMRHTSLSNLTCNMCTFESCKELDARNSLVFILVIYPIELVMKLEETLSPENSLGKSLDNTGPTLAFLKDLVTLSG